DDRRPGAVAGDECPSESRGEGRGLVRGGLALNTPAEAKNKQRVFVAGATGVLGTRAVRWLNEAGHDVTGVARSDAKAELLKGLGATPVRVDLFDADAVRAAVAGHDVVCNLATRIPPTAH